jgi:hypothetical protein
MKFISRIATLGAIASLVHLSSGCSDDAPLPSSTTASGGGGAAAAGGGQQSGAGGHGSSGGGAPDQQQSLSSPDGAIVATLQIKAGVPTYTVARASVAILDASALGMKLGELGELGRSAFITGVDRRTVDTSWKPVWGAASQVREHYNEMVVHLEDQSRPGRRLDLVFRAFDDGLGFRYVVPAQEGLGELSVTDEDTEFRFAADGDAFWTPADFEGDESLYSKGKLSSVKDANTPMTVRLAGDLYVALHEADLDNYAAMTLQKLPGAPQAFRSALVPAHSGAQSTAVKATVTLPFETPWRTLTIGKGAGDLIASFLVQNLNDPCSICDGDTSWIKPSKYMGVWWEIHKGLSTWEPGANVGATTENTKRYIDFASSHQIPFVLAEGWNMGWDGSWTDMDYTLGQDRFDLDDVVAYGKAHNVGFMAHMETGANVDGFEAQIDKAFTLYESLGIHGVKTGYVGAIPGYHHYSQRMVNHYAEVAKKAAAHKIMINVHEPIKPTGEERTYPNFMTREGLRGMEWNAWSAGNPASHTLTLPFTRMLGGPLDYNPGIFDILWAPPKIPESPFYGGPPTRVHTTRAHQLSLYVLLLSGLQMVTDLPEHYEGQPELTFIEDVPATWDETRVLHADIGEYLTIARRSGSSWFLGSGNANTPRVLSIPLNFLPPGAFVAETYTDAAEANLAENPTKVERSRFLVTSADTLVAAMESGGGQAARLRPTTPSDLTSLPAYRAPKYVISNMVAPADAVVDDFVLVTADVHNTGNLVGGVPLSLSVNGKVVEARLTRINADATASVAFEIQLSQLGASSVAVGDAAPKVVNVISRDTAPAAPADLHATLITATSITLAWTPSPGAIGYRLYRHLPGGIYGSNALAEVSAATTTLTDSGLSLGQTYAYIVRALYAGNVVSPASNEALEIATAQMVAVTFRVLAPKGTPSMDTLYMPGSIDVLGPWDPGLRGMKPVGGDLWEVTLDLPEGTALQYKYTRGSWERVEWWGAITSVSNRAIVVPAGSGSLLVDNTSGAWGDPSVEDIVKGVQHWRDPLVEGTVPADGAVVSATTKTIELIFNRDIDPTGSSGYQGSVQVKRNGAVIAGSVAEATPGTLTFTPDQPLAPGAYTVLCSEVLSSLGSDSVAMQAPYPFGFTVQ